MTAAGLQPSACVPVCLRQARFVPRERARGRAPQRVTPGSFRALQLPVPADPREWNSYRLSRCQGWPWSEAIDRHTARRGAEILPGPYVAVDCDSSAAGDGLAELHALAAAHGTVLDLTGACVVRTPGNGRHEPGWHLWWAAPPTPVRSGALPGHPLIEIKARCTAPGSPGYTVVSLPAGDLRPLPRWLALLAAPEPGTVLIDHRRGAAPGRLSGIVSRLAAAEAGSGRNRLLFWCACRCAEMITTGELDTATAVQALYEAAEECGYVAKHGPSAARSTIASGLRQGRVVA